jgi:hypothetical protein
MVTYGGTWDLSPVEPTRRPEPCDATIATALAVTDGVSLNPTRPNPCVTTTRASERTACDISVIATRNCEKP